MSRNEHLPNTRYRCCSRSILLGIVQVLKSDLRCLFCNCSSLFVSRYFQVFVFYFLSLLLSNFHKSFTIFLSNIPRYINCLKPLNWDTTVVITNVGPWHSNGTKVVVRCYRKLPPKSERKKRQIYIYIRIYTCTDYISSTQNFMYALQLSLPKKGGNESCLQTTSTMIKLIDSGRATRTYVDFSGLIHDCVHRLLLKIKIVNY